MEEPEIYIQRCTELAENGRGTVAPNPMVGAVIVKNGSVLAEGYHRAYGQPHAEVEAMQKLTPEELQGATVYVNLEPCSHYDKTPPCADRLIAAGISNVVIGTVDPNPKVSGAGIRRLQEAGIGVVTGVLEKHCEALNLEFFTFHRHQRPYITLKWAESANGKLGGVPRVKISHPYTDIYVHQLRAENKAIMAGKNTVLHDQPQLSVRKVSGASPIKMLIDPLLEMPVTHPTLSGDVPVVLWNTVKSGEEGHITYAMFERENFLQAVDAFCYTHGLSGLLVEGGAYTLEHFIQHGHFDRIIRIRGQVHTGTGPEAPSVQHLSLSESFYIHQDLIEIYVNPAL